MIYSKWLFGKSDFSEAYNIRKQVFVTGLGLSEEAQFDEYDARAFHLLIGEDDKFVATGRLYETGGSFYIGGIAVLPEVRGEGIGDLLVRMLLNKAFELLADEVYVYARKESVNFYKTLNFTECEETHEMEPGDIRTVMKVTQKDSPLNHACKSCGGCGGH
ncbi:MAG: GNAT family N-acetyltransferase [Clostridia bacterium]|nr:GNAT family N-acetyltransferase [Clostridia bacterium]